MQKKLKLDLEQLNVDTFESQAPERGNRGTVRGHASDWCDTQYDPTCNGYGTCGIYPCKQVP